MNPNSSYLWGISHHVPTPPSSGGVFTINVCVDSGLARRIRNLNTDSSMLSTHMLNKDTSIYDSNLPIAAHNFLIGLDFSYHGAEATRALRAFRSESFEMRNYNETRGEHPPAPTIAGLVQLATQATCDLLNAFVRNIEADTVADRLNELESAIRVASKACKRFGTQCESMMSAIRSHAKHQGHIKTDGRRLLCQENATFQLFEAIISAIRQRLSWMDDNTPRVVKEARGLNLTVEELRTRVDKMRNDLLEVPDEARMHMGITFSYFNHTGSSGEDSEDVRSDDGKDRCEE